MHVDFMFPKATTNKYTGKYNSDFSPQASHPQCAINVSDATLITAILNTGLGAFPWPHLNFNAIEKFELLTHLHAKFSFMRSAIDISGNNIKLSKISEALDSSESGSLSYHFGMIFSYIATEEWLKTNSLSIKDIFHTNLLGKSLLAKSSMSSICRVVMQSNGSPDLLCEDQNGDWHIIEAKGGKKDYKNTAINDALKQLSSISILHHNGAYKIPKTTICSFLEIPHHSSKFPNWNLTVVDPEPTKDVELLFNSHIAIAKQLIQQQDYFNTIIDSDFYTTNTENEKITNETENKKPTLEGINFKKLGISILRSKFIEEENHRFINGFTFFETLCDVCCAHQDEKGEIQFGKKISSTIIKEYKNKIEIYNTANQYNYELPADISDIISSEEIKMNMTDIYEKFSTYLKFDDTVEIFKKQKFSLELIMKSDSPYKFDEWIILPCAIAIKIENKSPISNLFNALSNQDSHKHGGI